MNEPTMTLDQLKALKLFMRQGDHDSVERAIDKAIHLLEATSLNPPGSDNVIQSQDPFRIALLHDTLTIAIESGVAEALGYCAVMTIVRNTLCWALLHDSAKELDEIFDNLTKELRNYGLVP